MVSPAQSPNDAARSPRPTPRPIAFYLPQFHPIPENNVFWGNGFTEWSAVVRTRPLFPDHYQPRIPADLGFYDLRLPEARQAQADLAREHGIHGFCYYHYWFEGRRVLERPFEEMLGSGQPDFPFCLCWANHNWTWMRDARDKGRLVAQDYGEEDSKNHIRWLLGVFRDERYIRVNGRPLVLVYRADDVTDARRYFGTWREEAEKAGEAEPYICKVDSFGDFRDPAEYGCDAAVEFWPHGMDRIVQNPHRQEEAGRVHLITEYRDLIEEHLKRETPPFRRYPCVVPSWDNTARFKSKGARIIHGSTPELYEGWLRRVIEKFSAEPPDEQLVFVNAWNEWAEGAYLEPDFRYGRAYLEANRRALQASGVEVPVSLGTAAGSGEKGEVPAPTSTEELYRHLLEKYGGLQKRLVEQMSVEEQSPLVQKADQQVRELQHKNNKMLASNRVLREDRDRLIRWMQELDDGIMVLLNSRRWKLSEAVLEIGRRLLRKPHQQTVEDHLFTITGAFRNWKKDTDPARNGKKAPPNGRE